MKSLSWLAMLALAGCVDGGADLLVDSEQLAVTIPNNAPKSNPLGSASTFSANGGVDLDNEFFDDFGTNGRTCGTCHTPEEGWTISAEEVQDRFFATGGLHPIFRLVDGANSPNADVSSFNKRLQAYSMLLERGVIRVGIGIPANAEFELIDVDDPYNFASAAELSLFRRPLPSANLGFIPAVMWDGRVATGATIPDRLAEQANGATLGHAQATTPLTAGEREAIVDFEFALTSAQTFAFFIGNLTSAGANGGPEFLASQARVNAPFNLFDAWNSQPSFSARRSVARGQALFNGTNANGGSCRGCHNVQNVGTSFAPIFFDIGVSAGSRRTPDMPLYTLRNKTTGEERETTDPGRALITGLWSDVDRFKAPSLRALGARAPYFHNGSADSLYDVVEHYEDALGFVFTQQERNDLVAFLSSL
jgi:cytochrome c peroxidase